MRQIVTLFCAAIIRHNIEALTIEARNHERTDGSQVRARGLGFLGGRPRLFSAPLLAPPAMTDRPRYPYSKGALSLWSKEAGI